MKENVTVYDLCNAINKITFDAKRVEEINFTAINMQKSVGGIYASALDLLEQVKTSKHQLAILLSWVLHALKELSHDKKIINDVNEIYKCFKKTQIANEPIAYHGLLVAYYSLEQWDTFFEVYKLAKNKKELSKKSYRYILKALYRRFDDHKEFWEVYSQAEKKNDLDAATYSSVIKLFGEEDASSITLIFDDAKKHQKTDVSMHQEAIKVLGSKNWKEALKVYDHARQIQQTDEAMWTCVLQLLCTAKAKKEFWEVCQQGRKIHQVTPRIYAFLFKCLIQLGEWKKFDSLYLEAKQNGNMTEDTYYMLFCKLYEIEEYDSLLKIYRNSKNDTSVSIEKIDRALFESLEQFEINLKDKKEMDWEFKQKAENYIVSLRKEKYLPKDVEKFNKIFSAIEEIVLAVDKQKISLYNLCDAIDKKVFYGTTGKKINLAPLNSKKSVGEIYECALELLEEIRTPPELGVLLAWMLQALINLSQNKDLINDVDQIFESFRNRKISNHPIGQGYHGFLAAYYSFEQWDTFFEVYDLAKSEKQLLNKSYRYILEALYRCCDDHVEFWNFYSQAKKNSALDTAIYSNLIKLIGEKDVSSVMHIYNDAKERQKTDVKLHQDTITALGKNNWKQALEIYNYATQMEQVDTGMWAYILQILSEAKAKKEFWEAYQKGKNTVLLTPEIYAVILKSLLLLNEWEEFDRIYLEARQNRKLNEQTYFMLFFRLHETAEYEKALDLYKNSKNDLAVARKDIDSALSESLKLFADFLKDKKEIDLELKKKTALYIASLRKNHYHSNDVDKFNQLFSEIEELVLPKITVYDFCDEINKRDFDGRTVEKINFTPLGSKKSTHAIYECALDLLEEVKTSKNKLALLLAEVLQALARFPKNKELINDVDEIFECFKKKQIWKEPVGYHGLLVAYYAFEQWDTFFEVYDLAKSDKQLLRKSYRYILKALYLCCDDLKEFWTVYSQLEEKDVLDMVTYCHLIRLVSDEKEVMRIYDDAKKHSRTDVGMNQETINALGSKNWKKALEVYNYASKVNQTDASMSASVLQLLSEVDAKKEFLEIYQKEKNIYPLKHERYAVILKCLLLLKEWEEFDRVYLAAKQSGKLNRETYFMLFNRLGDAAEYERILNTHKNSKSDTSISNENADGALFESLRFLENNLKDKKEMDLEFRQKTAYYITSLRKNKYHPNDVDKFNQLFSDIEEIVSQEIVLEVDNQKIILREIEIGGGGYNCGFDALGITRREFVETVLSLKEDPLARSLLQEEIQITFSEWMLNGMKIPSDIEDTNLRKELSADLEIFKKLWDAHERALTKMREIYLGLKNKHPNYKEDREKSRDDQIKDMLKFLNGSNSSELQKAFLDEQAIESRKKVLCKKQEIFERYIKSFLNTKQWLGVYGALLYAKKKDFNLYIVRKETSNQLKIITQHINKQNSKTIYLCYTNSFTHFNILKPISSEIVDTRQMDMDVDTNIPPKEKTNLKKRKIKFPNTTGVEKETAPKKVKPLTKREKLVQFIQDLEYEEILNLLDEASFKSNLSSSNTTSQSSDNISQTSTLSTLGIFKTGNNVDETITLIEELMKKGEKDYIVYLATISNSDKTKKEAATCILIFLLSKMRKHVLYCALKNTEGQSIDFAKVLNDTPAKDIKTICELFLIKGELYRDSGVILYLKTLFIKQAELSDSVEKKKEILSTFQMILTRAKEFHGAQRHFYVVSDIKFWERQIQAEIDKLNPNNVQQYKL